MPGIQRFDATLAAGATVANLLAGTFMERAGPRPEVVTVFGVVDNIAGLAGFVTIEFRLGNVVVGDAPVVPLFTVREGPNRNEHKIGVGVAAPFDLIQLRLFNGAAATVAPYRFLIESVMM